MAGYSLGIDLGTSYLAASAYEDSHAVVVPLADDSFVAPSAVYMTPEGQVAIGPRALERGLDDPTGLVLNAKRLLGSSRPKVVRGQKYTPEALMAVLLRWVVEKAGRAAGSPPDHVTLTHPANWLDHRRDRLREVAAAVGLEGNVGLQPEPDAAAVYHAGVRAIPAGATIGVYDLGGGTFDATIIRKTAGGLELVGEPAGVDNLGGIDFDEALRSHVLAQSERLTESLDETDPVIAKAMSVIDQRIVEAKLALSSATFTDVSIDLPSGFTEIRVTREEFNELIRDDIELTVSELERAVEQASLAVDDLTAVLLVGGSSRIPLVSEVIGRRFICEVRTDDHPKLAVSLGAAITAGAVTMAGAAGEAPPASRDVGAPVGPKPEPAVAPLPSRSQLRGAHGTLHIAGSGPSAVQVSVDLVEQNLAAKTDDPLGAVPLQPSVDPFPRHLWLRESETDTAETDTPQPTSFRTDSQTPESGTGFRTDLQPLIVLGLIVATVVLLVLLVSLL